MIGCIHMTAHSFCNKGTEMDISLLGVSPVSSLTFWAYLENTVELVVGL